MLCGITTYYVIEESWVHQELILTSCLPAKSLEVSMTPDTFTTEQNSKFNLVCQTTAEDTQSERKQGWAESNT